MNRVTLAIVLFFSVALGLYWQAYVKKNAAENTPQSHVIQPDFVADNLTSVSFNDAGEVESRLSAAHMEHFDASNQTTFTQPVYLLYPANGQAQWRIQASEATLDKNSNKVVLQNNVIIDAISPNEPIQHISTSYVSLNLKTMVMTSDKEIHIQGNDFTIRGQGLHAELNKQTVELLHEVTGIYEPD
ncbi:lipopolysaccharide export system protein LptC [Shewanella sp. NFH-SH190041]|uniref:LPS export ABC transporter periplasmic protein LptC n=1 Tax=Shewanella sp. NFH-SH190041 TaxID=2950245 RepID=UPI0021C410CA|nr:LPS export ABC transporter periplasmic protein LptC [Shewanella sp. NFH-SH190041]BDM63164.1 lipopolysaccharide export system protein LptC [Shewanella sp. NFH-SH190041]